MAGFSPVLQLQELEERHHLEPATHRDQLDGVGPDLRHQVVRQPTGPTLKVVPHPVSQLRDLVGRILQELGGGHQYGGLVVEQELQPGVAQLRPQQIEDRRGRLTRLRQKGREVAVDQSGDQERWNTPAQVHAGVSGSAAGVVGGFYGHLDVVGVGLLEAG